jgi:signal transduction histidine kinase/ligand-binding sensor domain-containing protein
MSKLKVNIGILMLLLVNLAAIKAVGQPTNIEFDRYTTNDGLSNGYINTIFQDSQGFIWICTGNGLNRFDGIAFQSYFFDNKDSTSIPGSRIHSMIEDNTGRLWVLTSNGFCTYNRETDSFSRKKLVVNDSIFSDFYANKALIDREGYMWISSYAGIFKFKLYDNPDIDKHTIPATKITLEENDVDNAFKNYVFSFIEDDHGKIWIVSNSKYLYYNDKTTNQFEPYEINHPSNHAFRNETKRMIKSKNGDFYITIDNVGMLVWHRKEDSFKLYEPGKEEHSLKGKNLFSVIEDKDGKIWIADRDKEGINIFNPENESFTQITSEEFNPYSLITNKAIALYKDKNDNIWVGTIIGVNKYSPHKAKFKRYFSSPIKNDCLSLNNVLCFEEGNPGEIWIGTDGGGLNKFDRKTGKFTHFKHDPARSNSISSNAIISIKKDHEGTLWIGTYEGGLVKYKNNSFEAFLPDSSIPYSISTRNIWYAFEDSKQNLWVATLNKGIDFFDRKTSRFFNYSNSKRGDPSTLSNNTLNQVFEDSKGNIYFTTFYGVSVIDLEKCDFTTTPPTLHFSNLYHNDTKNSLSSNFVYCINEDLEGNLWFGTFNSGIDKYDRKTGLFTNYSTKDGLPGNQIFSILVDNSNNLWLATDNGLVKFQYKTNEIEKYGTIDGLQNKSLKGWALKANDGEMFFGGPNGFNSFYPADIKDKQNQNLPPVLITGLKIFNKKIKIGEKVHDRVLLPSSLNTIDKLHLTYKENFFTIEFIALDYTSPERNNYAYKMEGFDNDWVYSGNKRDANYTNLDPDTYTFRVKASNNDGIWNEEGASIKVSISPPWWETWWFRIISILFILTSALFFILSRLNRLKKQKIELIKIVDLKTFELQQSNTKLIDQTNELIKTNVLLEERQEEIQAQSEELLTQKESLELMNAELYELNATKDKFFSIIAHDIKSPFNVILGLTELLSENFYIWDEQTKVNTLNTVSSSSKNLFQLLENLLHWSRSQRGVLQYSPEKINIKNVFLDTINLMKSSADVKEIEIIYSLTDENLMVYADRFMFETIIRNLVSNAIKFTWNKGKIQLKASIQNEYIRIEVIDNGIGISNENQRKLFRIDNNLTTTGTNNETGTGLGLILVKDFVTKQGGEIGVTSKIGEGTTFFFTLPQAKSDDTNN